MTTVAASESGASRQREGGRAIAPGSVSRPLIELTIAGLPVAQGSKRWTGRTVIESNDKLLRPWRAAVAAEASEAMAGAEPLQGPIRLHATFTFPRPKVHYGTGRNAGQLKPGVPLARPIKPDLDKLVRALFDAMSGIVYRDDAQVVELVARKLYGSPAARVVVVEWSGT